MKRRTILLHKPVSMTPFQVIQNYRLKNPQYEHVKLGYAGRLDPMAEGLLLVLVGDENKRRKHYEDLPKTYSFSALFGIETDSYDILGIPQTRIKTTWTSQDEKLLDEHLLSVPGKKLQPFPPFSSKPVLGKPLYKWAREDRLHEINIPSHMVEIFSVHKEKTWTLTGTILLEQMYTKIKPLKGLFRQTEILTAWENVLKPYRNETFQVVDFSLTCSSGTYVRGIVHDMGKKVHKGALALSIKRTGIGDYVIQDAIEHKKTRV